MVLPVSGGAKRQLAVRYEVEGAYKSSIALRERRRASEDWLTGVFITAAVGFVTPMVPVAVTWALAWCQLEHRSTYHAKAGGR